MAVIKKNTHTQTNVSVTREWEHPGGKKRYSGTHKDQAHVTMRIFQIPIASLSSSPEFGRYLNNACIFVFVALEQSDTTKCKSTCCAVLLFQHSISILHYVIICICILYVVVDRATCVRATLSVSSTTTWHSVHRMTTNQTKCVTLTEALQHQLPQCIEHWINYNV